MEAKAKLEKNKSKKQKPQPVDNTHRIPVIKERLQTLQPDHLEIIDESYKHVGHEGAKSGKGHFKVIISAPLFKGLSKLQAHRKIYAALGDYMNTDIHALTIKII